MTYNVFSGTLNLTELLNQVFCTCKHLLYILSSILSLFLKIYDREILCCGSGQVKDFGVFRVVRTLLLGKLQKLQLQKLLKARLKL